MSEQKPSLDVKPTYDASVDVDQQAHVPDKKFQQPEVISVRQGSFGVIDDGDTTGFGGLTQVFTLPGATPRPYGSWFDEAVDILEEEILKEGLQVNDVIEKVVVNQHDQLIINVKRDHLRFIAKTLRDDQDLRFEMCLGVSSVN